MNRRHALLLIALLGCGLWAWSFGLSGPYHFDDYVTPLGDPASQSLSAWTRHLDITLRPVTKLTYALEASTTITATPAARRIVSLLLLTATAGLFLLLIRRLAPGASMLMTMMLTAVWFVHPVHADSVLLASGRTAVLSGLFVIAALLAVDRSRRWLAAVFFLLACLSRETALAALLPLSVLAAARHPGSWRTFVRELAPSLTAGALVVSWMLMTPRYMQLGEYSMLGRPFLASVIAQVGAVPVGLGLLFRPAALSIDYGLSLPVSPTAPLFLLGLLLYLSAAAGVAFFLRRSSCATAVGLAVWLAALLPTQSVIPKLDALTNRPLSLALAGLLLVCIPIAEAVRRRPFALAAPCGVVTVVVVLAMATVHRAELFRSELSLWQDAAAKSRVNDRPHLKYALLLDQRGRHQEALAALSTAAQISPLSSHIATLTRVVRRREARP